MNNEHFNETLKAKLDELKEKTVFSLTKGDSNYRKLSSELGQAEKEYMALSLSTESKIFIDYYISLIDNCNMEYSTTNYLAGLIDGQKFGNLIPTNCNTECTTSESILKCYYQLHQPCAECYESSETLAFWKELNNNSSSQAQRSFF